MQAVVTPHPHAPFLAGRAHIRVAQFLGSRFLTARSPAAPSTPHLTRHADRAAQGQVRGVLSAELSA